MDTEGLFSLAQPGLTTTASTGVETGFGSPAADAPLPVRMRPAGLDELVGQEHLLAPGAPLRQLVTGTSPMSVILWGPPGTGKTTIAHLVAHATDRKFVAMSALTAGVKDVRAVIDTARRQRRSGGPPTVLFIDEVHRFSKTQQDSLLAAVEDRTVTLLAATTENPYFSVISPLLSRCVLLTLQALDEDDVRRLIRRAVSDPRGLGGAVTLAAEAENHVVRLASGDVRKALTALEAAAGSALAQGATEIDLATAERAVDVAAVRYDRDGDAHYDVTSAFIKSMRGSDPDAALHYLARMLVAGEDPRFIARRIVIFASEDVGMADPQALLVATAAAQAVQLIGMPEAQLNLAQAVVHVATAPKSNSVTTAIGAAMADVRAGRGGPVPSHLRDAHYPGSKGLGHGLGYRYPHDDPRGVVRQQYVPDDLVGTDYYRPTDHGAERAVGERVPRLRRIVRGLGGPVGAGRPGAASAGGVSRAAGGAPATDASQSSSDSASPPPAPPDGAKPADPAPDVTTPDVITPDVVVTPDVVASEGTGAEGETRTESVKSDVMTSDDVRPGGAEPAGATSGGVTPGETSRPGGTKPGGARLNGRKPRTVEPKEAAGPVRTGSADDGTDPGGENAQGDDKRSDDSGDAAGKEQP
ncbi:replication-associated recombination protein A [Actinoplanes sp. NPDC051851]|uniref:replication-associated recombination protein A n=1 Tax=Actinoplanes sp. NPDC051851 TaxID=3154753 RepID=UPI00342BFA3B